MVREERVLQILQDMIHLDSETNTVKEKRMEQYLQQLFAAMDNVVSGLIHVPNDAYDRAVVYGLIQGQSQDTVIFLNHHDVVGVEDYGQLRDLAFEPEKLRQALAKTAISEDVRKDIESGDWLFGRGSCDMKGGAAAQLAVFEAYAKAPQGASLLYVSLPDEESYSSGMRAAITLLDELKNSYHLSYRVLIDSEPNARQKGKLISYTGSVGKIMPVVLVQGKPVHIGRYQKGLNPVGVMARLIAKTEGDSTLADRCENDVTPPPAWVYLRDRKEHYDVTLPQRVAACLNMLTYAKTPDDVMYLLLETARQAVQESLEVMESRLDVRVLSAAELLQQAHAYPGFDVFYEDCKQKAFVALQQGKTTYVQATIRLLEQILEFTGRTEPLVVVAFAPPYYPAADSMALKDKRFAGLLQEISAQADIAYDRYFNGISDCSYCCVDPALDEKMVERNLLLWGKSYQFDFPALKKLQIPFLLLGPWGKDLHERTERVQIESVSKRLPAVLAAILAYVGRTVEK